MGGVQPSAEDDDWPGSLIPDSLIAIAADGAILRWNAGAEALYGFRAADAIGRQLDDLLATRHPFGLSFIAAELDHARKWQGEVFRTTGDDRTVGITLQRTLSALPSIPGASVFEWSRAMADASPLDVAAHRYTNLFNAMAASFWELDFAEVRRALMGLVSQGVEDVPGYLLSHPGWIDDVIPQVRVLDVNEKTLELFAIPDKADALANPMDWAWPAQSWEIFARALIAALRREDQFTPETVLQDRTSNLIDDLFTVCWPEDHKARGSVLVGVIDLMPTMRQAQGWIRRCASARTAARAGSPRRLGCCRCRT